MMDRAAWNGVKSLLFIQAVLIFCAGLIPDPYKVVAFAPGLALVGGAVCEVVYRFFAMLERNREQYRRTRVAQVARRVAS
jgi:hypothetical protein